MPSNLIKYGVVSLVIGFCLVAGGLIAHDLNRFVDDDAVIWLINRAAAAYVIGIFFVLGIITAKSLVSAFASRSKERAVGRQPGSEDSNTEHSAGIEA
ncbi:MAG: hypothetical protein N2C12_12125 [Planctomycetales bacterium]